MLLFSLGRCTAALSTGRGRAIPPRIVFPEALRAVFFETPEKFSLSGQQYAVIDYRYLTDFPAETVWTAKCSL
jgi:hypothetical protein